MGGCETEAVLLSLKTRAREEACRIDHLHNANAVRQLRWRGLGEQPGRLIHGDRNVAEAIASTSELET
jgi:hypothetical protein